MGYAILRIEPRKSTASAAKMLRHALREDPVPNALPDAPKPTNAARQGYGYATSAEALQSLAAKIESSKKLIAAASAAARAANKTRATNTKAVRVGAGWQKGTTEALDILVTASREDMLRWSKKEQGEFFKTALDFIAERFGGKENILCAAIHRDESTPHMQVILAPVDPLTGRFSASRMVGGIQQLRQLQDAFHAACGAPFGLDRGIQRTGAKHVPVKAFYGAMEAGVESPQYVDVPPEPGLRDRVLPGYAEKKAAHDEAVATNAKVRKTLAAQAKRGRMVHPVVVERQAALYRKNLLLKDVIKAQQADIQERLKAAESAMNTATSAMRVADDLNRQIGEKLKIMDKNTAAKIVARFSRHLAPAFVSTLSVAMGIPLVAGRDIPDQVRRAGLARTLDEAVELMEKAADGQLLPAAIRHGQGQGQE